MKYILVHDIMEDTLVHKEHKKLNMFSVVSGQFNRLYYINGLFVAYKIIDYAVSSQSWTFKTDFTQKLPLYAVSWYKQPPEDQITQFWHQVSMQYGKAMTNTFFLQ